MRALVQAFKVWRYLCGARAECACPAATGATRLQLFVLFVPADPRRGLDSLLHVAVREHPPTGVGLVPIAASPFEPVERLVSADRFIFLAIGVGPENPYLAAVLR